MMKKRLRKLYKMKGHFTWTANDKAFMKKHYGKMNVADIAKALNKTVHAIHKHAFNNNLTQKQGPKLKMLHDAILANYKKMRISDQAKALGISQDALRKYLTKLGLAEVNAPYRSNQWKPEDDERLKLLAAKTPVDEIAKALGRTSEAVRARIKRQKLTVKPPRKEYERLADASPRAPRKQKEVTRPIAPVKEIKKYADRDTTLDKVPVRIGPRTVVYLHPNYSDQDILNLKAKYKIL
jgi:DNA-binding transcriptional MerR regulator